MIFNLSYFYSLAHIISFRLLQ